MDSPPDSRNSYDGMEDDDLESVEMMEFDSVTEDEALEIDDDQLHDGSRNKSYGAIELSRGGTADSYIEINDSDDDFVFYEASEKVQEASEEDERQQLVPSVATGKRSSYIPPRHGKNAMDKDELRIIRMSFENLEGQIIDNVRHYDILAMLSKNIKYLPSSKKQAFIDWLKTLEQKWRNLNKPREDKKLRPPHPRTPADILTLLHSLKPKEKPKGARKSTMASEEGVAPMVKPSKSHRPVMPNRSRRDARQNMDNFLSAPRGKISATRENKTRKSSVEPIKAVISKEEEEEHPWMPTPELIAQTRNRNGLLLRAWDQMSECRINDHTVGFLSGASWFALGSAQERHRAVDCHANWGSRVKTPFISTTTSIKEIIEVRIPKFTKRQTEAGIKHNTKLTIINAHARLAKGLPILKMTTELDYYNVNTPYANHRNYKNSFFDNEYLLLFRADVDEIVATWCWQDIERTARQSRISIYEWFRTVAVPLYDEHETARKERRPMKFKGGCACCGH